MPTGYRAFAGEYDQRASVYKNASARTANADGQRPESAELVCTRWISVMPSRAIERFLSQQTQADVTHAVRMRRDSATADITAGYWLTLADGTRLDIVGVFDVDSRRVELLLECNQRT